MTPQETVLELRRLELEIIAHEKALEKLRRESRELLEVVASRPRSRDLLDRDGRQRFLAECGGTNKRSQ